MIKLQPHALEAGMLILVGTSPRNDIRIKPVQVLTYLSTNNRNTAKATMKPITLDQCTLLIDGRHAHRNLLPRVHCQLRLQNDI